MSTGWNSLRESADRLTRESPVVGINLITRLLVLGIVVVTLTPLMKATLPRPVRATARFRAISHLGSAKRLPSPGGGKWRRGHIH
jgi:hypothetical protein